MLLEKVVAKKAVGTVELNPLRVGVTEVVARVVAPHLQGLGGGAELSTPGHVGGMSGEDGAMLVAKEFACDAFGDGFACRMGGIAEAEGGKRGGGWRRMAER